MTTTLHHDQPPPTAVALAEPAALESLVADACRAIAPLWGLRDLVAVNPYLGLAGRDPLAAEDALQRWHHAAVLPSWRHLREAWEAGAFSAIDLAAVCQAADPTVETIANRLAGHGGASPEPIRCLSAAGVLDRTAGGGWVERIVAGLGRYLAARSDEGVARWGLPATGCWAGWRSWATRDAGFAAAGLRGVPAWIAALPADAAAARADLVSRIGLPAAALPDYFGRLLGEVQGWAGWLRQQAWHDGIGELPDLLGARLALDVALIELHPRSGLHPELSPPGVPPALATDRAARWVAVRAWEHAWRRGLLGRIRPVPAAGAARPAAQAVFCIDVRSEGLRRQLEAADAGISTLGFAGFFGVPLEIAPQGRPQCPVLLRPGPRVGLAVPGGSRLGRLIGSFRRSPGGGFAYMETAGPTAAWSLLLGALGMGRAHRHDETAPIDLGSISLEARVELLAGMLRNLGLGLAPARLVLLCGHDSTVANNPQAAGLACGACGGHGGAVNARVAAALYNTPDVRNALGAAAPPADSIAVAALHDTATDEVRILDAERVPASHAADLARLQAALARAGGAHRAVRAAGLPGMRGGDGLLARLRARSRDWAEVRPEWGLAGNAAFIAAPRAMSAGADLGGRCFLHSYDAALDPDGSVLALILTAPVVVASWINLQYWASTVDPERLGSGSKTLHTVVGGIGVACGADGDLLTGLAWESVHDGERFRHQPLRLQVLVAAAAARIDAVVAGHDHLRDLVGHGWIVVHALDPATGACRERLPGGGWREVRP